MSTVAKPIALDETLQSTNTALGSLGKDTTLQAIATAIANVGLSNIGNMSSLATTDKTSLVSAINEVVGDVSDLDTDKADKVASATNGNLAGLNGSGNLTDSGWASDKTTTSASGNPISITGLKSNQLAVNPVITFEPIQAGSGDPSPSNVRAISGYDKIEVLSCGKNLYDKNNLLAGLVTTNGYINTSTATWKHSYTPIVPNKQYTLQGIQPTGFQYAFYNANGEFIEVIQSETVPKTFTTPNNAYYIAINTTSSTYENTTQLELGNQATTYEPYHKTTDLSEPLAQTVYGGSLDLRSGIFTVTKQIEDLGNLTWIMTTSNQIARASVALKKRGVSAIVSDYYEYVGDKGFSASTGQITDSSGSSYLTVIFVGDARIESSTTATQFKTMVEGQKIVFELEEPIEIQLTPHEISLLKDYAYVSTNGTSIALDYHNGEIATLGDVAQLGETVNKLWDGLPLKFKRFYLSSSVVGTSFSPTTRRIDLIANLFGDDVEQSRIVAISIDNALLTPGALLFFGFHSDTVYIASTQNTTLSGGFWVNLLYLTP